MSPPLNPSSSPTHSSSNSTTPPSEATLADEPQLLSDAIMPPPRQSQINSALRAQILSGQDQSKLGDYDEELRSLQRASTVVTTSTSIAPNSTATTTTTTTIKTPHYANTTNIIAIDTDYDSSSANEADSDVYSTNKYDNAEFALLSYARTNKVEKLCKLLEAKLNNQLTLDLNFKGQQKKNFSWSALHLACYFGHTRIVEALVSNKKFLDELDINIQNNSGDTPLHKATLTKRTAIVQLLLSHGANVFIRNSDGQMAKQLTNDEHVLEMLEAAEQVDRNRMRQEMFKAVDSGDLKRLQEYFEEHTSRAEVAQEIEQPSSSSSSSSSTDEQTDRNNDGSGSGSNSSPKGSFSGPGEMPQLMTDDRGNTLLHIAAMRGYTSICVFLLERGFDPYKENDAGQSCISLSSYQLRQLFTTVKPTDSQLKKFSRQRVIRFEGPLLKKVRILGWKQIYVVLENGVILLFNNRRDSMNRSRRGYKYLESATCVAEPNDLGMFTVCFSDRSRATFLITNAHLSHYPTFKLESQDNGKLSTSNQVELIRQKWIDSMRDHIQYSTNFIQNGLKLNDKDDEQQSNNSSGDLATLNHLLPIDTIKSFIQEARAHYSILERHSESLCNLIHTIHSSNRLAESVQLSYDGSRSSTGSSQSVGAGNRLLGLIKPSRSNRTNSAASTSVASGSTSAAVSADRSATASEILRNNSLTDEFIQDNWHCVLFHLRLLVESTQNTRSSMDRALALMEHQEQLRQHRIQDQEERCRILEESLHALARDHHELEKSLSMSQIYHSATGRSMSLSTDLNDYQDAFEDFDDEKTMTPNSMPSDEDLYKKIQEIMEDEEEGSLRHHQRQQNGGDDVTLDGNETTFNSAVSEQPANVAMVSQQVSARAAEDQEDYDEEDEDEDLRSNCSALTVETVSEQYISFADKARALNIPDTSQSNNNNNSAVDDENSQERTELIVGRHRTRLPAPMVPRDQVSIWSILKNCIGKELSKITMPVVFNEPLTMLQRASEGLQYSHYLKMADESNDPIERMELVCTYIVAGLACNCERIIKPFNPLLYETYEYVHELEDGSHVRAMAQQVSHHPPITAAYSESDNFINVGSINPKLKFWGRSVEIHPDGQCKIFLKRHNESYVFKSVACSIHNIIVGKLWFEHSGPLDIKCIESKLQANLIFKPAGWFTSDVHKFEGTISNESSSKKKIRFVYGKWSHYIKSVDYNEYEKYMKDNQQFRIPDDPDGGKTMDSQSSNGLANKLEGMSLSSSNSVNNNSIAGESSDSQQQEVETKAKSAEVTSGKSKSLFKGAGDNKKQSNYTKSESAQSLDIPNSRTLWRLDVQYLEEYYNFTPFTLKLNELTPELSKTLPRSDSRFRPDVRKLEEGDLDGAASEKHRLEEKQRQNRSKDKRFKDPSSDMLWFEQTSVPYSKEKIWTYKGGYWESKCNLEKFPDLF